MAGKGAKRQKRRRDRAEASAQTKPPVEDCGYDWGWPALEMIAPGTGLLRGFQAGGFVGCSYGFLSRDGPPFIALVGKHLGGMRSGLAVLREWAGCAGPNAIRVEILFDGPGYVISVGQQHDLLAWLARGIDPTDDSLLLSINVVKRLDTRHPFLNQLARYSRQPVAPVYLTVAGIPPNAAQAGPLDPADLDPIARDGIMLPGIEVYCTPEDRPRDSMVWLESEIPPEHKRRAPPDPAVDPASLAQRRERRLLAAMPKTMHVLRHRRDGRALVLECSAAGCTAWQVEQAVCNLRLEGHLAYRPRGKSKRLAMLNALRSELVEPASIAFEPALLPATVLEQVFLDAAFLLRRIEPARSPPKDLAGCNARLRELGYA